MLAAGYVSLDIVTFEGRRWHAAGGSAANVAAIFAFLEWKASVAVDVGNDLAGREILRDLASSNVSLHLARSRDGMVTPRLIHEINSDGHAYRFQCPDCGQRFPFSRPLGINRARELLCSEETPDVYYFDRANAATLLLAEEFRSAGSTVVYEPSRPIGPVLAERALDAATVVKRSNDRYSGLNKLRPRKNQVWIVTAGSEGAMFRIGNGAWHHSNPYSCPVVDAGGAGDWTTVGLIHTLNLEDRPTVGSIRVALRSGQALAALSCGAPGARGLTGLGSADVVARAWKELEASDLYGP